MDLPEAFWASAAEAVPWSVRPTTILDRTQAPFHRWFSDGQLNACYAALDFHVEAGYGQRIALIYDSPLATCQQAYTYQELLELTSRFAGALRSFDVSSGDRVVIYMPMIPQAVIAMLACARLGATHSVVFGGFAAGELASRIEHCTPKVIVSASCGLEVNKLVPYKPLLERALEMSRHKVDACIIKQRSELPCTLNETDFDYDTLVATARPVPPVSVPSTHPLYILYTSGTTGDPKGIVRDTGGYCAALKWSMQYIFGMQAGEVFWAASDIGWVVGHSYIVYGPLFAGCTTVLYEGKPVGTPDAAAFWRVVADHKVNALFTAPTSVRAIKREDPRGELMAPYDLSSLRCIFLAGERADPDTVRWLEDLVRVPVVDNWWQTELGWPALATFPGLGDTNTRTGSAGRPVPGYFIEILNEAGNRVGPHEEGKIVIRLPLPPGCLTTMWKADAKYKANYLDPFPGYYLSGDAGYIDEEGYVFVMGRVDDVINVAGHRLSTGAMEEVLAEHPAVAECAVVGIGDALKGEVPIGFVVMKAGVNQSSETVESDLVSAVRDCIGPVSCFRHVYVVKRLPKTRSGKILRKALRAIVDGERYSIPATIEEPGVLDDIQELFPNARTGYDPSHKG